MAEFSPPPKKKKIQRNRTSALKSLLRGFVWEGELKGKEALQKKTKIIGDSLKGRGVPSTALTTHLLDMQCMRTEYGAHPECTVL